MLLVFGLAGCPAGPTSALVTLTGLDAVQSLTITVTLPSGSVQRSFGALTLPQTALVQLPDQAVNVSVIANAIASDGQPVSGSNAVVSVPHAQLALTVTFGQNLVDGGADGAGDGGALPSWHSASNTGVTARHSNRMVYDSLHQQMVMFGGVDSNFTTIGGTFTWDGTQWTKRTVAGPGGRRGFGMAYDSNRHVVVMFGGSTGGAGPSDTNEVWEWDGASLAWANKTPSAGAAPTTVIATAIAYHAARQRMVVFGGYSVTQKTNPPETWEWDGTSWALQSPTSHPPPDNAHAMVYDSARQVVVLFTGRSSASTSVDVWEYDATGNWSKRPSATTSPSRRRSVAAAYDPVRHVSVLFGGLDIASYTDVSDTWEWNGSAWTQRMVTGPGGRRSAAVGYDEAHGQLVLFGGGSGKNTGSKDSGSANYFGDTWTLY